MSQGKKVGVKLQSRKYVRTKNIRLGNYCPKIVAGVEGFYQKKFDVIESLKKINLLYEHPRAITGKGVYCWRVLWWEN
jgi:hypothetical protein